MNIAVCWDIHYLIRVLIYSIHTPSQCFNDTSYTSRSALGFYRLDLTNSLWFIYHLITKTKYNLFIWKQEFPYQRNTWIRGRVVKVLSLGSIGPKFDPPWGLWWWKLLITIGSFVGVLQGRTIIDSNSLELKRLSWVKIHK